MLRWQIIARITYASLFLNFTPDATNVPTQTQIGNLIKNYYQQMYGVVYGIGNYPSDDSDTDTSDPDSIIRAKEVEGDLVAEISTKVQQWHDSGINSDGQVNNMPKFTISDDLAKKLKGLTGKKLDRIASIRLWGHEYDSGDLI